MGIIDKLISSTGSAAKNAVGKGLEKFGTKGGLLDDSLNAVKNTVKGLGNSAADLLKSKNDRNNKSTDPNFTQVEVSLANRNTDAISNILNGVVDGNLFDAGLDAIRLYNYGTKWYVFTEQYQDKELYPFKYYSFDPAQSSDFGDLNASETGVPSQSFLDSIEDPSILGYAMRVDFDNSPLFGGSEYARNLDASFQSSRTIAGYFINYLPDNPQLAQSAQCHAEFVDAFKAIFTSPEALGGQSYRESPFKNHYITKVDGLDKLDEPFVDLDDTNFELKITLAEDVRFSTRRLVFLYNNMAYSRNMGSKLIPPNLLHFTLYIKISDVRSFTRDTPDDDKFRDVIENASSRIIYELKDCELFFDTLNPASMSMGGTSGGVDMSYATVTMRIKYKRVHRIFYGRQFNAALDEYIIGDKFFQPDDEKTRAQLQQSGFDARMRIGNAPHEASKRNATSNNIPVVPSLTDRLTNLRVNGLFSGEDANDNALTRFAKTVGNNAVKTGAGIVDEGLHKVEDAINNAGKSLSGKLRGLVQSQTVALGTLHADPKPTVSAPEQEPHLAPVVPVDAPPLVNLAGGVPLPVIAPHEDLMPNAPTTVGVPTRSSLYTGVNVPVKAPAEDLAPPIKYAVTAPAEDLAPPVPYAVDAPAEDLAPDAPLRVTPPDEDLAPDAPLRVTAPDEDLAPPVNEAVGAPNERLHGADKTPVTAPDEDLAPEEAFAVVAPSEDLAPDAPLAVTAPREDLMPDAPQPVVAPAENLAPYEAFSVVAPKETLASDSPEPVGAPLGKLMEGADAPVAAPAQEPEPAVAVAPPVALGTLGKAEPQRVNSPVGNLMAAAALPVSAPNERLNTGADAVVTPPQESLGNPAELAVEPPVQFPQDPGTEPGAPTDDPSLMSFTKYLK